MNSDHEYSPKLPSWASADFVSDNVTLANWVPDKPWWGVSLSHWMWMLI